MRERGSRARHGRDLLEWEPRRYMRPREGGKRREQMLAAPVAALLEGHARSATAEARQRTFATNVTVAGIAGCNTPPVTVQRMRLMHAS